MPVHIECLRYANNHIIRAVKLVVLISYHCYPVNADKVCKVVAEQVPFLSVKSNLLTDSGIVADSSQGVNKVEHWFSVLIKDHERCVIEVSVANEILMHFRSLRKTANDVSIHDEIESDKDGNSLSFLDVVAEEDTILDDVYRNIRASKLLSAIDEVLDSREKTVIRLRYGLSEPSKTQKETAVVLGISRSYVSRIEKSALQKLKDALADI